MGSALRNTVLSAVVVIAQAIAPRHAPAQTPGLLGTWHEPGGSMIEIFRCNADLCAKLVAVDSHAPSPFDINNPDSAARRHPLCGLQIGYGFHLTGPTQADDGRLYDPRSGKTYHGAMTLEGNTLHLRGYIGLKLFGRSETWTRASAGDARCETAR